MKFVLLAMSIILICHGICLFFKSILISRFFPSIQIIVFYFVCCYSGMIHETPEIRYRFYFLNLIIIIITFISSYKKYNIYNVDKEELKDFLHDILNKYNLEYTNKNKYHFFDFNHNTLIFKDSISIEINMRNVKNKDKYYEILSGIKTKLKDKNKLSKASYHSLSGALYIFMGFIIFLTFLNIDVL